MIIRAAMAAVVQLMPATAFAQDQSLGAPLDCSTGPVNRAFGGTDWLVYSCSDAETLVIVSAAGSPALPFYFQFFLKDGRYQLAGEGTGSKAATDAAYNELKLFTQPDIQALIDQTRSASPGQN